LKAVQRTNALHEQNVDFFCLLMLRMVVHNVSNGYCSVKPWPGLTGREA